MNEFTAEDEGALMDGIEVGLGFQWSMARRWIAAHQEGDTIFVTMRSPAGVVGKLVCQDRFTLAKAERTGFRNMGKCVAKTFVAFLKKHQKTVEAARDRY